MKHLQNWVGLGVAVCLLCSCGQRDASPRIVCDLNGSIVPTAFTFDSFERTLTTEHGQVERTGYEQLKTRSVLVTFAPPTNQTVLAQRVVALHNGSAMSPAVFFGLTNAPPSAIPAAPSANWDTNGIATELDARGENRAQPPGK